MIYLITKIRPNISQKTPIILKTEMSENMGFKKNKKKDSTLVNKKICLLLLRINKKYTFVEIISSSQKHINYVNFFIK